MSVDHTVFQITPPTDLASRKYALIVYRPSGMMSTKPVVTAVDRLSPVILETARKPVAYAAFVTTPDGEEELRVQFPSSFNYLLISSEHVKSMSLEQAALAEKEENDLVRQILGEDSDSSRAELTTPDSYNPGYM